LENITGWIEQWVGIGPATQAKILYSVIVILIIWVLRTITVKTAFKKTEDLRNRYRWQKSSGYIAVIIGVVAVGRVWISGLHSLVTYRARLSAGIAIALR
jgi:carbon monoxide dehydrogenase subunit G